MSDTRMVGVALPRAGRGRVPLLLGLESGKLLRSLMLWLPFSVLYPIYNRLEKLEWQVRFPIGQN